MIAARIVTYGQDKWLLITQRCVGLSRCRPAPRYEHGLNGKALGRYRRACVPQFLVSYRNEVFYECLLCLSELTQLYITREPL